MMGEESRQVDDELSKMLMDDFSSDEQQQFVKHFQMYLDHGTDDVKFVIDLDNVWEWMGFGKKGNAKSHLIKFYKQDTDFKVTILLPPQQKRVHGGQNKETIMMNVNTFKSMCMTANTERGKQTRLYYTKMETIFFKYMEQKHMNVIENITANAQRNTELERQRILMQAYANKPCVYILKICGLINIGETNDLPQREPNASTIVKVGETDDIYTRLASLRQQYKNCVLLEVFPCVGPHKFEQTLFKKPILDAHRVPGTELFQLSDKLTYDKLKKLIKNLTDFSYVEEKDTADMVNKRYLANLSQERTQLLHMIATTQDEDTQKMYQEMLVKLHKEISKEELQMQESNDTSPTTPASNRKVYKLDPNNLQTPVAVYNSLREAARSTNNPNVHDYHLRDAFLNNKIVENFRWYMTHSDEDLPPDVPETETDEVKQTKPRRTGLVAQLDNEKKQIINVYPSQNDAASALKIAACSVTIAISNDTSAGGFYWKMYEDCTDSLKETFDGELPQPKRQSTCSKKVNRIDPRTNEVVEVHPCIQDVCSKYRICHKKMNSLSDTGEIYKGFIWWITT
jgi:phage anti-repressor protein